MQALFKNSKGETVEAVVNGIGWKVVTRTKKPVRVHRRSTTVKGSEDVGKVLKEVMKTEQELSNDEFKAQFNPVNHAAVDLMDSMPDAEPVPKKVPKPNKPKTSTE